ncbi:phosphatase, partial [Streptomyces mutabilis]
MTRTWQITDITDAARARIATARLAAAYGVPPLERARLLASLGAQLRLCLTKGGTWRLTLEAGTASPATAEAEAGQGVLHAVVTPSRDAAAAGQPPWRVTVPCPEAVPTADADVTPDDPAALAEALLGADEDTVLVLDRLT